MESDKRFVRTLSMSAIFLIGYMASGKTTFGKALARHTGRPFIDLDFYIEQRFHTTIRRMFDTEGEDVFRHREKAMLHEAGEFDDVIVACGGGTPCFFDNMDFMLARGTVVFLDATPERITERLCINNSKRPLMAGKSAEQIRTDVEAGLAARLDSYRRAHVTLPSDRLESHTQIADTIAEFEKLVTLS